MIRTLLVSCCIASSLDAAVLQGTYLFRVDRVADHPPVGLPSSSIPDSLYRPGTFPKCYDVNFSADGDSVLIDPGARKGSVDTAFGGTTVYTVSNGMARFVVRQDTLPYQAELTLYGSGVPVISSERGVLLDADDPQHDPWFVGLWLIHQPYHALYEATQYRLNADGSIEMLDQYPSGYETGSICRSDTACTFGSTWRSAGRETLLVAVACTKGGAREAAFAFADTQPHCTNPQIWCGAPSGVSVNGDTAWRHCSFEWAWVRCTSSDAPCTSYFTSARSHAPSPAIEERTGSGAQFYSIQGRRLLGPARVPGLVVVRRDGSHPVRTVVCPNPDPASGHVSHW